MFETIGWIKREPRASNPGGRELTPELFDAMFG